MDRVALGTQGLEVSRIGLGCMRMSTASDADPARSKATIERALERDITMFDTSDSYGPHHNERLLGEVLRDVRDDVVIATKFGQTRDEAGNRVIDGSPEYVRAACDASLERLGVETIDLYYLHRVDRSRPIEETIGAMSELVDAGKVRYIGVSEAGAENIRRAHAVHPLTAVQTEYSLWTRVVEDEVLPTLTSLGISLVAYSPLGRGFFTPGVRERVQAKPDLARNPRFSGENFARNEALLAAVEDIAAQLGCSPSQVALAWLLAKGEHVVPIPGTSRPANLDQNLAALDVDLDVASLQRLDTLLDEHEVAGDRYPAAMMPHLDT